jgi:hypothetical protein
MGVEPELERPFNVGELGTEVVRLLGVPLLGVLAPELVILTAVGAGILPTVVGGVPGIVMASAGNFEPSPCVGRRVIALEVVEGYCVS